MNARQLLLNVLVVVVLLAVGGGIAYANYQGNNYVSTSNAQIAVPIVHVDALAAGTVQSVAAGVGDNVPAGRALATVVPVASSATSPAATAAPVATAGAKGKSSKQAGRGAATATAAVPQTPAAAVTIRSPVTGIVSAVDVSAGQTILPGQPVADVAEPAGAMVVANIPETAVRNIAPGQTVDVTIDAFPGVAFTGYVHAIDPATQASLSLFPASALSGSFTKVTQLVPVYISLDTQGHTLYNGLSAEVRIHIGNGAL